MRWVKNKLPCHFTPPYNWQRVPAAFSSKDVFTLKGQRCEEVLTLKIITLKKIDYSVEFAGTMQKSILRGAQSRTFIFLGSRTMLFTEVTPQKV